MCPAQETAGNENVTTDAKYYTTDGKSIGHINTSNQSRTSVQEEKGRRRLQQRHNREQLKNSVLLRILVEWFTARAIRAAMFRDLGKQKFEDKLRKSPGPHP